MDQEEKRGDLALLTTILPGRRLLLVWADVPFPPTERPPRNPALVINRWLESARSLSSFPWPVAQLPPLPILSLNPTDRLEATFRQADVHLNVVRTRHDVPAGSEHNLLKLGGDLATRTGLFLSWDDVQAARNDPDKAHLLREVHRLAQDGVVLVLAPDPTAAFARLWRDLLAPAVREAAHHFVLGPADFPWPAPLQRLDADPLEVLAALEHIDISPPAEPVLHAPSSKAARPSLLATTLVLPFGQLSPADFERLCLWLVEREGYVRAEHLGLAGSEQGRDVIAYKPTSHGEELWYFQCKRYRSINAKTLKGEVDKYLRLAEEKPHLRPAGVVFVVSCAVSARVREEVGDYCDRHGLAHEFWARTELDMRVKRHPDLLREFFNLVPWVG